MLSAQLSERNEKNAKLQKSKCGNVETFHSLNATTGSLNMFGESSTFGVALLVVLLKKMRGLYIKNRKKYVIK